KRGWNIKWAASAHPKNILICNNDELDLIKESGCSRILIGAESGNDDELKYIKKNMTKENVIEVANRLGKREIHGSFTVIVGYPGFPEENIDRTLDFGRMLREISSLHEIKAHIYAPYPGTPLYEDSIRHGFAPPKTLEDWAQYDYYEAQTPWLRDGLTERVRDFNRKYCPYVL
ncbi:MAG: radical SAM protein, partial [Nanoarchaeota archaeon]